MGKEVNYKLYRELDEILHPSISRQNISNYEIIMQDSLIPVGVFYPQKEVALNRIIIYITTENSNFCNDLAIYTNNLVLAVHSLEKDFFTKCYDMLKYIYHSIENYHISKNNITIMSDYDCKDILEKIIFKSKQNNDFTIHKEVFLSHNTNVQEDKNKLLIPDINSYYYLDNQSQFFQEINEFLT